MISQCILFAYYLLFTDGAVIIGKSSVRNGDAGRPSLFHKLTTGKSAHPYRTATGAETSGLLTTASGLIFSGDNDGNVLALDSRKGTLLWRYQMGANLHGTSAITYMVDGRQHVLVPAGTTLTAWALPQ